MASPVGTRLRQQRESCAAAKVKISRKARCEPALCEVLSTPLRRKSGERRRTRPGVWRSRPTRVARPGELTDASAGPTDACGGADQRVCRADQRVWRGVWRSRRTRVAEPTDACAGPTDADIHTEPPAVATVEQALRRMPGAPGLAGPGSDTRTGDEKDAARVGPWPDSEGLINERSCQAAQTQCP